MNIIKRVLGFGKGLPAAAAVWLIVGAGVFMLDQAVREVPEWVLTSATVTEVDRVLVEDDCSCSYQYRTTLVIEEATDGKIWTLHRDLSSRWDIDSSLRVYEVTNGDKPSFELSEPQDALDIKLGGMMMGLMFGCLPAGVVGACLYPHRSGGYSGGGGSSSFDGGSSAAVFAATSASFSSSC